MPDGHIKANPNPKKGKFTILSHPEPKIEYISGTDPIPFSSDELVGSHLSEYCIVIKDRTHQTYVAYYAERSLNADAVIDSCILLQDYYFAAKTNLEMNHGGVAREKYKEKNRLNLLAPRATVLGAYSVKKSSYGWFKDARSTETANELFIKYLYKYTNTIWFRRMITELEVFLSENTDLLDAVLSCEMYDANLIRLNKFKTALKKTREIPQIVRDAQGKTKMVMKKLVV